MRWTNVIGALLAALPLIMATAQAEEEPQQQTTYSADRYQLIIERSPFGVDPLELLTEQQKTTAAAKEAAKKLRLCFLYETQDGEIRAGFQNLNPAPGSPKSIILMVNESFMDMKLIDIDLRGSKATLESQGNPVVFELEKAAGQVASAAPPAKATPRPTATRRSFGGGFRNRTPPPQPAPEPPKLTPEEQEARRAEVRKNLQEYQMEVIRKGMPPLPVPLTPEMDDQLVAEGVLPPMEEEAP